METVTSEFSLARAHEDVDRCFIAKIPFNDILWNNIVSPFLEIKDICRMEQAFTNKLFYRFQSPEGNRLGLFMNINWDSSERPVIISSSEQVQWLEMRNIRLCHLKCVGWAPTIVNVARLSHGIIKSIDLSCYNHALINEELLRSIGLYCGSSLRKLILTNCDVLRNISIITSVCPNITSLILNSVYRMTDDDCLAISKDLPSLLELDLSYCDKITMKGLKAISSMGRLQSLSISKCPRLNDVAIRSLAKACPHIQKLNVAKLHICDDTLTMIVERLRFLEELNINDCAALSETAITSIAQYMGPRLRKLYASSNRGVNDDTMGTLASFCPRLTALNISFNDLVSDLTLRHLAIHCPDLRDVDLALCSKVTDNGVILISDGCRRLENIKLVNCIHLTDASVIALSKCSNLIGVDISHCPRITALALEVMKTRSTVTLLFS